MNFSLSQREEELEQNKVAHAAEVSSIRSQLEDMSKDLQQRNVAMATLSERVTGTERQVREQDEALERKNAELHVSRTIQLKWIYLSVHCFFTDKTLGITTIILITARIGLLDIVSRISIKMI